MSAPAVNGDGVLLDPLTDGEYDDLEELETRISKGLDTFVDVGNALAEIRDRRLYRQYFPTFAAYCEEQWEMGKSKAYALIHAAALTDELSGIPDTPLPANPAQVDALGPVADDPEAAADVMRAASADGPATAKKIAAEAEKRAPGPSEPDVAPPKPEPEPDPEREMDFRQKTAADAAHQLADRLSRYELVHERTIRLMEARCRRWREAR